MQVLMVCRHGEQMTDKFSLYGLRAAMRMGLFVDSLDGLVVDGNRLYSQGEFDFALVQRQVELFPSYVVMAECEDDMSTHPSHQLLQNSLAKGHPYCQHILFDSKKLNGFVHDYLGSADSQKVSSSKADGEAFIHIASVRERVIKVLRVNLYSQHDANVFTGVREQLEFELAKLYYALVSSVGNSEDSIDKSICLKISFQIDSTIDLRLNLLQLEVVTISNYHQFSRFDELLGLVLADLLAIKQARHAKLGTNNSNYVRACLELGVICEPVARNMYFIKHGDRKAVYIPYHRTVQSKASINTAESKLATNEILRNSGFDISKHIHTNLSSIDATFIDQVFDNMTPPFVVKPTDQSAGYGVYLNIGSRELMSAVIDELKQLAGINEILIEEQFTGTLYRFIVIGNRVEAVMKSSYPIVFGNGADTMHELIQAYNSYNTRKIRIDSGLKLYLNSIGQQLYSVPEKGKAITVSLKKNGDVTQNVSHLMNEKYKHIAIAANSAIGLRINGVDMMIAPTGEYRIIELNPVPALYPHLAHNYGESIDLFKTVILYLLDNMSLRLFDCTDLMCYHS
jgi:D-alanine-D-alanine ligase-like ATP-grasp enzyme